MPEPSDGYSVTDLIRELRHQLPGAQVRAEDVKRAIQRAGVRRFPVKIVPPAPKPFVVQMVAADDVQKVLEAYRDICLARGISEG